MPLACQVNFSYESVEFVLKQLGFGSPNFIGVELVDKKFPKLRAFTVAYAVHKFNLYNSVGFNSLILNSKYQRTPNLNPYL
jgi:hypothetical protein